MSDIALKVENLYKRYRLGAVDRQAFKEDIVSWWASVTGKPDPYEQYITSNDLAAITDSETLKKLTARYVWALQDINFEVKKGEIVGIIGKNGAGKSTLLKILSKTTTPTKGQVKVNGRIASLLEVGTGFHGELTGRENIYLNGAILGMTRHEIKKHLDEIVAFAGIDAYIDTPVKRYSSGMYVRLAFAVGAHLLSDILIVDEVLAVGDAEFQKKCIGKMKDVSKGEGKTVLFVSHNMTAVKSLCNKGFYIKNGLFIKEGEINTVVDNYLEEGRKEANVFSIDYSENMNYQNETIRFLKVTIEKEVEKITIADAFAICFEFENRLPEANIHLSFLIYTLDGVCVFNVGSKPTLLKNGKVEARCFIPANYLNDEYYRVRILVVRDGSVGMIDIENCIVLHIHDLPRQSTWYGKWHGVVRPNLEWKVQQITH